jgi:Ca-activated chloride channel family protein
VFEFAHIWVLVFLPLPFLVYWLMPPLHKRSDAVVVPFLDRVASATGQKIRKGAWISKRSYMQWAFLFLAWVCLLLALAKPQIVGQPAMKLKTARSFLVAADISFSMAAKDWVVEGERFSRWEAVKKVMAEFIEKRQGDRMALVFFGTNAYLQTPFTTELDVVQWFLEETDVGMAGQMTSIGKAIGFGMKMFNEDTLDQKVMLLLTDGQDGGKGLAPLDAAYLAKADSVKIYTMGIGDPDAPGSDLDEGTLKQISEITDGHYFRAIDQDQLRQVYTKLDELEPIEFEEEENKPVTALYYYPLIAALILGFTLLLLRGLYAITKIRTS